MHSESTSRQTKRTRALRRTIDRLARRLQWMQTRNQQISNARLVVFIVAIGLLFIPPATIKWVFLFLVGVLFFYLVIRHHFHDQRMKRYQALHHIKKTNLARATVKWDALPPPAINKKDGYSDIGDALNLVGEKSLHHLMDISISDRGSLRLAQWLTADDPEIATTLDRQRIVEALAAQPRFRERLLLEFYQTSKKKMDSKRLVEWLSIPMPERHVAIAMGVSFLLIIFSIALFGAGHVYPLANLWLVPYALYGILFLSRISSLVPLLDAAQHLDDELGVFRRVLLFIERYTFHHQPRLTELLAVFQAPGKRPSKSIRLLKIGAFCIGLRNNPITALLLNMVFPWDMVFAWWTLRQRSSLRKAFPIWLDTLSTLESLNSLANFAYLNPDYHFPHLVEQPVPGSAVFKARSLGHPLIAPKNKVTNDFAIENIGDICLITGSNMAGKSTFLKTVGINLMLAYAGAPVSASSLTTGFFKIRTCINVGDSLTDGVSAFYAEVKRLKEIMKQIEQSDAVPVLYLIDEILRGTNNRERLIGSQAMVEWLTQTRSVGLISTHDLELTALESAYERIFNYHFSETIQDGKMHFLFKLQHGPCPTTNALEIMKGEGLPVFI
ncbi:MutS: DNA mismatch repair protein [Desulfosarcina variabilis str. Montpellier]|uniref:MutS family DNA mismatch repair protein n=1 Tax=Desulfosarcina variabilis TaxID=2300 RepID=UPI003AFA4616